jgi:hypothetical protein
VLVLALGACNAHTGIDGLTVEATASDGGPLSGDPTLADGGTAPPRTDPDAEAGPPSDGTAEAGTITADASDGSSPTPTCAAQTIGPVYGNEVQGGTGWTNRQGVLTPGDGIIAQTSGNATAAINVRSFGLTVPPTATILGIIVEIHRGSSGSSTGTVADERVMLSKGISKNNGDWPVATDDAHLPVSTYGAVNDTWGATWTGAEVDLASFGVGLKAMGTGIGLVDAVGVTVVYCPSNAGN